MTTKELTDAQAKTQQILHGVTESIAAITRTLEPMAASIAAHDSQIEALIQEAEEGRRRWANLERQWQAYINRLPGN